MSSLLEWLRAEERRPFRGWDFSYIRGRVQEEPLPWSYEEIARAALPSASTLLDLGTGGGERLAALAPLSSRTFATEGYLMRPVS